METDEASGRRIPELDGLRGIAVLAVCAVHLAPPWPQRYLGLSFGWAGVDLFFVLSGFLITGILRRSRGASQYYLAFYARRARRILPPALLVLTAAATIAIITGRVNWPIFAMYAAFTTSLISRGWWAPQLEGLPRLSGLALSPMWSLSVEEIFYLIWAPAVRHGTRATLGATALAAIIVAPLLRFGLHAPTAPEQYLFVTRMDALAWGALAALGMEEDVAASTRRWVAWALATTLSGTIAIIALTGGGDPGRRLFAVGGYTMLDATCAAVLIAAVARPDRWSWLRRPMLVYAGTISYTLYLVHLPMRHVASLVLGSVQQQTAAAGTLALALSVLIAALSWRYFEAPLLTRPPRPAAVRPLTPIARPRAC